MMSYLTSVYNYIFDLNKKKEEIKKEKEKPKEEEEEDMGFGDIFG